MEFIVTAFLIEFGSAAAVPNAGKLNDGGHGARRLRPQRAAAVRSAWMDISFIAENAKKSVSTANRLAGRKW
jgi:hypothetical protein